MKRTRAITILAALLLSGCEMSARIEDQPREMDTEASHAAWDSLYIATHTVSTPYHRDDRGISEAFLEHLFSDSLTNTGPHAVVLSDGERCLLLRPGESGAWSGPAEISTPDGYEVNK